jgi:hypothetical protein
VTRRELIGKFAEAIARMEGFYTPRSISQRNNNPGNLRSWGKRPQVKGFAKFPTPTDGWVALRKQIDRNIDRGLTTAEFFAGKKNMNGHVVYPGYAPATDGNDPLTYAKFVAMCVGIDVNAVLQQCYDPEKA